MRERAIIILFILFFQRTKRQKNKMKIIACGQNVRSPCLDEKFDLISCTKYTMMILDDME
jgi:hypothetical protein